MVFKPALTFASPGGPTGSQQGFPAPGSGAQYTGAPWQPGSQQPQIPWTPERPSKGTRTFFGVQIGGNAQRGGPGQDASQLRPKGSMPVHPMPNGLNDPVWTPYYDRGAAAIVQNYGKVFTNPIGAGIQVLSRTQSSYGPSAQYINGQIFWTTQTVPTSIGLQGLNSPAVLQALLGAMSIQAVVRED